MADMLIVSRLAGTCSMSAVNIVAQYLGAGRQEEQQKAIETSFAFILRLSVITTAALLLLADPLLKLLQTPKECYREAWNYYMIYMAGTVFVFFYNAVSSVLRGLGDSRNPLCMVPAHVLGLGVVGIGLAYPVSTFFTDLTYFYFYFKGDWKKPALSNVNPSDNTLQP